MQPRYRTAFQFNGEFDHCFQFLIRYGTRNVINRFVPLNC
jgi:hypothetical protein